MEFIHHRIFLFSYQDRDVFYIKKYLLHAYLKVRVEAEQEGFSGAIAMLTDSEWIR